MKIEIYIENHNALLPNGKTSKTAILLLHGFRSNSNELKKYVKLLNPLGYACFVPNHIGHGGRNGQSLDWLGMVNEYYELINDWQYYNSWIVIGHSLGGTLALALAKHPKVKQIFAISAIHDESIFIGDILKYFNRLIRNVGKIEIEQIKRILVGNNHFTPEESEKIWLSHGKMDLIVRFDQFEKNVTQLHIPSQRFHILTYGGHYIMGKKEIGDWIKSQIIVPH